MSPLEALMLVCFGAAWPFSIYRSATSGSTAGKSLVFMLVLEVGYIAGMLNKILYGYDLVFWLYVLNFVLVGIDSVLWVRNRRREKMRAHQQTISKLPS